MLSISQDAILNSFVNSAFRNGLFTEKRRPDPSGAIGAHCSVKDLSGTICAAFGAEKCNGGWRLILKTRCQDYPSDKFP